jgi:hypothetical protein
MSDSEYYRHTASRYREDWLDCLEKLRQSEAKVAELQSRLDEIEKREPELWGFIFPSGKISSIVHRDKQSAINFTAGEKGTIVELILNKEL